LIDVSTPAWEIQRDAVMQTLDKLDASDKPTLTVFNKIDMLSDPHMATDLVAEWPDSVAISAATGKGIGDLMDAIRRHVQNLLGSVKALIPYTDQGLVQDCYDFGRVFKVDYREDGIYVEAELVAEMRHKLAKYAV
jgi:GTPase